MNQFCTQEWLSQSPSFTSFRVNKLKEFDTKYLEDYLYKQSLDLNVNTIPKFYFLTPDCLIIEQWPLEVSMEKCENEVIVDAECAAAVLRGAHVYAPGVMGLPTNCLVNERIDIYGDIEGKCNRGLKVKYEGRKRYVGTGYLKMQRKDLFENDVQPSGIAIHTLLPESKLAVVNETLCPKGVILLQNLPSIVCGWVVNARQDEYILDMCSAPGNKTTHLAEMSSNKAFIIAIDKTPKKVQRIRDNCENHGVTSVMAFVYDSTKCCSESSIGIYEPPFPPNSFDKVLLDAPCSGLGQRPRLTNKITPNMLQSYQYLQRKLFYQAAEVLKLGGKLVYSTCTINKDENEGIVSWALKNIRCLKLVPAEPLLGGPGLPDVGLTDEERIMVQRFGPEIDRLRQVEDIYRDGIGFFIASFTKV